MNRRAKSNDYSARRIYMITRVKNDGVKDFSRLSGDPPGLLRKEAADMTAYGAPQVSSLNRLRRLNNCRPRATTGLRIVKKEGCSKKK